MMNSALLASSKVSLIPDHCHGSMDIVVLGLNHKTAPVSIRERVVLSTCNRIEIYGDGYLSKSGKVVKLGKQEVEKCR